MNPRQFYIKSSNSLSALALELINEIKFRKSNLFQPLQIVTQTEGMNNWLTEKMAAENGIAANIEFLKLNDLLYRIYTALGGTYRKSLSADNLSWVLYDILGDETFKNKFPELKIYYQQEDREDPIKRIELSRKISDLFDQYQAYRPDLLYSWNNGKLKYNNREEEVWQKELWNSAGEKTGKLFPDRLAVQKFIRNKIQDTNAVANLRERIPAIYIFGSVLLTELHQELLSLISCHIPVYIFLPNPAPEIYWYEDLSKKEIFYKKQKGREVPEDTTANPLLLNWGQLVQNTFLLLFQNDEIINLYESTGNHTFHTDSLLHSLQYFLSTNSVPGNKQFFNKKLNDGSLVINSCHSPIREIQSLYNYLVHLVDIHGGTLNARDIVVQVTDIDRYASYIRAVFDNAPYPFPYRITDETTIASDSLSKALAEILTLDASQFSAEAVMQLLEFASIRGHFNIYNTDLLRDVVNKANIRHGIEGKSGNETVYVSWIYGLKRIMYGICIKGGEETDIDGDSFYPLDAVEGTDADEVIHFAYFIDTLIRAIKERDQARSIREWMEYLFDLIQNLLFNDEEQDSEEYRQLVANLEKAADGEELFSGKIPYEVFLKQVLPAIGNISKEYHFASGGITFCSTIPMRSIPFKIVAMLGLDFDKFPRKNNPTGFDLMFKYPKKGDRSLKMNDKHLFLETVMSAGENLYLSYNGQDIQTNATKPPSILIDELLNFISVYSENPESVGETLVTKQPLHLFGSPRENGKFYFNYILADQPTPGPGTTQAIPEPEPDKISLKDIIAFYRNPVKWYYRKRLKIFLEKEDVALPETELFSLNRLEEWSLKNELLLKGNDQPESVRSQLVKTGKLPFGNVGRLLLQDLNDQIQPVKKIFSKYREGLEPSSENILLNIDGITLSGELTDVFGSRILIPCFSKNKNKYLFQAYIYSLISSAAQRGKEVILISEKEYKAGKISTERAVIHLRTLLHYFTEGSKKIVPFFVDISLEPEEIKKLNIEKFGKSFEPNGKHKTGEYILREYNAGYFDDEKNLSEYKNIAEKILCGYKEVLG